MEFSLSILLDVVILGLLGATVFFAARLSKHIQDFRESRKDLEGLIKDLGRSVDNAENAIEGLRENARQSGRDLQGFINEAKALSDELQIMNESGNSLASRLEQSSERRPAMGGHEIDNVHARPAAIDEEETNGDVADGHSMGFAIHDPEFDIDDVPSASLEGNMDQLHSQAEKDLYKALHGNENKIDAGV